MKNNANAVNPNPQILVLAGPVVPVLEKFYWKKYIIINPAKAKIDKFNR